MKDKKTILPYMDNRKTALLTVIINLPLAFIFQFAQDRMDRQEVVLDSLICGVLTVAIDITVIYVDMKRRRDRGLLSGRGFDSRFMQHLPKNPLLLALIYMPVSAGLIALVNWGIMALFGIESFGFWNWLVFKLIYSCLLSFKIIEYCIFRFIQPDWAGESGLHTIESVRDPLPKISVIKELYAGISANIVLNFAIGIFLGGVEVKQDQSVLIYPVYASRIWLTGIIFGLITGLILTYRVLAAVRPIILRGDVLQENPTLSECALDRLPKSDSGLTVLVCIGLMAVSAVILPLLMCVLGIEKMDFYQFCILVTTYGIFIGRIFSRLLTARCFQRKYIEWIISKKKHNYKMEVTK